MAFKKGTEWKGNPNGRPKGARDNFSLEIFRKAIVKVEKKKKKPFFEMVVERAYTNDKILIAVLKKILPDQQQVGVAFPEELLAEKIQFIPQNGDEVPERFRAFLNN